MALLWVAFNKSEGVESTYTAQLKKWKKAVLRSGKALPFLVVRKEELRVRLSVDPDFLATIKDNYQIEDPIVVMLIMGPPRQGKSTLLNYITQFCTKSRALSNIFEMKNTGEHTTRGSQVLSHPLYYKEQQIMLIDLEGLEGTETEDITKARLQQYLKSALLTVASVPCILVNDISHSVEFMEKTIAEIAKQTDAGFLTERVNVLFHDKDVKAEENKEFANLVRKLNGRYFFGRQVIKMLNKPNFVAENAKPQRDEFLTTLMDDSLYVKQNMQHVPENLQYLLINVIGSHSFPDLRALQPNLDEDSKVDEFVKPIMERIVEIQITTRSQDGKLLLSYFNEAIETSMNEIEIDLQEKDSIFRERCRKRIRLELHQIRAKIRKIEDWYEFIRLATPDEMKLKMEESLKHWTVDDLKRILKQIRKYFPKSEPTINELLATLKSSMSFYTNLAAAGKQVISVLANVGLKSHLPRGVHLAHKTLKTYTSVDVGKYIGGIISYFKPNPKKAVELVLKNGKVNEEVFMGIRANEEHPYLRPEAKAPVLLFLGSETTLFWQFANVFAKDLPFASIGVDTFRSDLRTQILPFDYVYKHPGQTDILTRSYLICLRLKSNDSDDCILKLARRLIPATAMTCLSVDDPSQYALPLLRTLPQEMNSHLVVVYKRGVNRGDMLRELKRFGSKHSMKEVEEFNKEQIEMLAGEIKEEFEGSDAQEYSKFRGKLVSLALDQEAMELVYINSMWGNNKLNKTALKEISISEEPFHHHLNAYGPVLLL